MCIRDSIKYKGKMKGRVARGVYELDRLIRKARRAGKPGYVVRWRSYTMNWLCDPSWPWGLLRGALRSLT